MALSRSSHVSLRMKTASCRLSRLVKFALRLPMETTENLFPRTLPPMQGEAVVYAVFGGVVGAAFTCLAGVCCLLLRRLMRARSRKRAPSGVTELGGVTELAAPTCVACRTPLRLGSNHCDECGADNPHGGTSYVL